MNAAPTTGLRGTMTIVAAAGLAAALVVGGLFATGLVSAETEVLRLESAQTSSEAGTATEAAGTASPSASPSPPPPDPCTLLTEADAQTVLGAPVTSVTSGPQCTYVADDGSSRAVALLVPTLALPEGASLGAGMEQAATALGGEAHELTGVGDEGFALTAPEMAQAIGRSGDLLLSAVLTGPTGTTAEQVATLRSVLVAAFARY